MNTMKTRRMLIIHILSPPAQLTGYPVYVLLHGLDGDAVQVIQRSSVDRSSVDHLPGVNRHAVHVVQRDAVHVLSSYGSPVDVLCWLRLDRRLAGFMTLAAIVWVLPRAFVCRHSLPQEQASLCLQAG